LLLREKRASTSVKADLFAPKLVDEFVQGNEASSGRFTLDQSFAGTLVTVVSSGIVTIVTVRLELLKHIDFNIIADCVPVAWRGEQVLFGITVSNDNGIINYRVNDFALVLKSRDDASRWGWSYVVYQLWQE
jgi:hypothetical protein